MRLFPRLFLLGAVVPSLSAALVSGAVVRLFGDAMEAELDRALLAQAAVESVSLFDGPRGLHLHMSTSPLLDDVRQFAPEAAVYDDHGARLLHFPATTTLPTAWAETPPPSPLLSTTPDGRSRQLAVRVLDQRGQRTLVLVLSASRAQLIQTRATLVRLVVGSGVTLLALLSALTFLWARRLSGRVERLIAHQARVSSGQLDAPPPADDVDDELGALRATMATTTAELAASRAARERFLAEAAHELRTPLASMRVALDLALRRAKKAVTSSSSSASSSSTPDAMVPDLIAALEDARDETGRLTALAQGLLDVTAARSAPFSTTMADVVAIARAAATARVDEAAARGIGLVVVAEGPVEAPVHPPSLRRALDNLVDNALQHARARVAVEVVAGDGVVDVIVGDDGPGIPAGAVEAVFAPFHRLHDGGGGVGLGLALVREVARRHGGEATASPGPGGRLVLRLPR